MANVLKLFSNIKLIKSGNVPTTSDLEIGEAAFGRITGDGKYHIYGNPGDHTGMDPAGIIVELGANVTGGGGIGGDPCIIASVAKPGGLTSDNFWLKQEPITP